MGTTLAQRCHHRALFGRFGRTVVATLCGYETLAITTGTVPTITTLVHIYRQNDRPLPIRSLAALGGLFILAALGHHWYIENPDCSCTPSVAVTVQP